MSEHITPFEMSPIRPAKIEPSDEVVAAERSESFVRSFATVLAMLAIIAVMVML